MLQPRKFKFKNKHKNRSVSSWRNSALSYGDCGIKVLRPSRISAKRIFRLKVYLKKAVKKSDITKRRVWFNVFPHLPLTKKAKGVRMGKGSGKLNTWFVDLKGGAFLLEFRNLRPGRADFFFKKVRTKITVPTSTVFSTFKLFNVNGVRSSLVRYTSFKG